MEELHPETLRYLREADPEHRRRLGQFFTPRSLREELLSRIPRLRRPRVLDPACGTGEFLLSARERFEDPELHCWEIDPRLVEIARRVVPEARVEVVDALRNPLREEFDVVLGNPPYFEFKPDPELRRRYGEIIYGRANVYALFVYLGLRLLRPGGYLAYVVSSSMNNGAYFRRLREFVVRVADVEYMRVLPGSRVFGEVSHTFQLLVLRKRLPGERPSGRYVFSRNGITVFSERADRLKELSSYPTLYELGYRVRTGRIVWNQCRDRLTDDPSEGVLLIWAHNIKRGRLVLGSAPGKPQYVRSDRYDVGPAIVVRRVVGHPSGPRLWAALVPPGLRFLAENHVNVVYPPEGATLEEMEEIVEQLNGGETREVVRMITGNTQISKNELEKLVPVRVALRPRVPDRSTS